MKRILHFLTSRVSLFIVILAVEAFWIYALLQWLWPHVIWLESLIRVFSLFLTLYIVTKSRHLSSDLMWILLILLIPVPATIVFIILNVINRWSSRIYRSLRSETERASHFYLQDPSVFKDAAAEFPLYAGQVSYIVKSAGFPVYRNTGTSYYPLGEDVFPAMLEDMKAARQYIFIEYFIIEEGSMWNQMLEILRQKAAEGVDCRVIYDDMGSIVTLPYNYFRRLEKMGIHAQAFNHVSPLINGIMKYRDHRKMMIVDGRVAYTGGINLADQYINAKRLYGHWKDTSVRVTGDAVYSFTVLFLTTWNASRPQDKDYSVYRTGTSSPQEAEDALSLSDGYIAPYGETPLDDKLVGESIYLNIINEAKRYCYICTPYLIIDEDMTNALILAAQRGVDVRILTPGIPDKRLVWGITRSYYATLIRGGVRIYEYTPGFNHAKMFVCDDMVATVGTLNLDYRSLYLHFENGVFLLGSRTILEIRDDFLETVSSSRRMTDTPYHRNPLAVLFFSFLRLFAPLM